MRILSSICLLFFLVSCSTEYGPKSYLHEVLDNLEQIESATYYKKMEAWAPGDTSASGIYYHYIKEYNNPQDTTIGACYVSLLREDTTQMAFCYDGNMRAVVYQEESAIVIDSFKLRKLPFRPLTPPFFNYTKNILRYALNTEDSISLESRHMEDSIYIKLTIYEDRQVEFFGKAYYMEDLPYTFGETISRYELWINTSNNLPYRVRREMSHDISIVTCSNFELNKRKIENFNASDYFQPDYSIKSYQLGGQKAIENELLGKVAPDWTLKDTDNKTVALKDLSGKILMIQFTSVSCGPCRASIPFLKQLSMEYEKENFDFVAIESFNQNSNVLKNYQSRYDINYKFLISTKDVTREYSIKSVPVFLILDDHRIVRKVIYGYGKGSTDKEIRKAIDGQLLNCQVIPESL